MKNYQHPNSESYQNRLQTAWEHFINNEDYDYSFIRPQVLESWKRSRAANVNPFRIVSEILSPDALNLKVNNNMSLIEIVHPYMERLYSIISGTGAYILFTDPEGYLLDYIGDDEIISGGQKLSNLVLGACRHESVAGTNAIGTAAHLKTSLQIWGNEHYCKRHKIYTCSGSPILDSNNNIIGVINVTLLKDNAHPHTLGMVMSAADSISKEINLTQAIQNIEQISAQRNAIIENMTSGLFLLTPTYRISQVNRHALDMLGLPYEQVIGKNILSFITIDDDIPCDNSHAFFKRERYNEEATISLLHSSEPPKRFRVSLQFIKDNQKNITGTLLRFNEPELIHTLVKNVGGFNAHYTFSNIIGSSDPVKKMINACKKAAMRDSNVLICGESGTGKELVAQAIHNASSVATGPFVAINCASIPNSLVESELFGYEKGTFTGADKNGRPGKFEMANGGTIFLDEIGDMPLDIQATLLRVIQTKEVVRIGGRYPKPINIRIIAATNQDLLQSIDDKTFRKDLYYRLNVFTINTPSLAERGPSDIHLLAKYFVATYNREKKQNITIVPEVFSVLETYTWPGNVRQLENVIERAINLTEKDGVITADLLPDELVRQAAPALSVSTGDSTAPSKAEPPVVPQKQLNLKEHEKALILSALEKTAGNVTKASKALDMNIRTLYRKLDKYQIDLTAFRG